MGYYMSEKRYRFRLPKTVVVKGAKYKVIVTPNVVDDDGKPCMGLHDHDSKEILIDKNMTAKEKRTTFLHELFHAYCYECNIREGLDSQMEEVLVETIAQAVELHFEFLWKK